MDPVVLVDRLADCGITHVVWIPDTTTGAWDDAFVSSSKIKLIRVCREGEAFGVAAGLYLGGQRPLIIVQCTGLFEAGDALRNFIHDLGLPLFVLIGLRNYHAHLDGTTSDTAPAFAEAILKAWRIPYRILDDDQKCVEELTHTYLQAWRAGRAEAVFLAE